MLKEWINILFDKNIINYIFIGLCALGLIIRIIVNLVYKRLVRESDIERLSETKNKLLTRIKKKFETCYKLKIGVNNVDIFVDKSILKYRFCGILLSTWDNAGGQVLFLNLLLVPITAVFGVTYGCGQNQILLAGAVGILSSAILIFVDKSMNISLKKNMLRLNLLEYLNNYCKVRLENPELAQQFRQEYSQITEAYEQTGASQALLEETKEELSRRKAARLRKEEEKRLLAAKREEELRKAEEARKEEERRRLEERHLAAMKRREEERRRLEEERAALEARLAEMKRKAAEKQMLIEQSQNDMDDEDGDNVDDELTYERKAAASYLADEEESKVSIEQDKIMNAVSHHNEEEKESIDEINSSLKDKAAKGTGKAGKSKSSRIQEDKLIEDVLKEFFA